MKRSQKHWYSRREKRGVAYRQAMELRLTIRRMYTDPQPPYTNRIISYFDDAGAG